MNTISSSVSDTRPNLYALLVGIDAYDRVRPLRGPVSDTLAVTTYLHQLTTEFALNLLVLTDQQASKAAIIDGFQKHLAQAGPNDVALFYFAGHGAQEAADPALWPTETDSQLECLVCHDAGASHFWDFLLTDKELRYLLTPISATGAHVVTLFDCCHSGDNTRDDTLLEAVLNGQDVRERRLTQSAPQRPYEAFCFHDILSAEAIQSLGIDTALPQGSHIQIAACESDESAVEINGEGVFTKSLLTVLNAAHGRLSYGELHNRIRQTMRFSYEQHPRLYIPEESVSELLNRGFLNQPLNNDAFPATVTYNKQEGWLLDVGAIHGIGQDDRAVYLFDQNEQPYSVSIQRIGADYSILSIPDDIRATLDKTVAYRATVTDLVTQPIRLVLLNHGGLSEELTELIDALTEQAGSCFSVEDDPNAADYCLHVRNGLYYLTRPSDENRPLIRPVRVDDQRAFTWLAQDIRHLARWQYLTELRNKEVATPVLNLAVDLESKKSLEFSEAHPAAVPIEFSKANGSSQYTATISVRLTNPTDQPVYCTALYLSRDFGAFLGFLPANYRLESGQTVTLGLADKKKMTGRQDALRLRLEEVIRQYNWPASTERIKFLVTTEPLSEKTLSFFQFDALFSPPVLSDRNKPGADRGGFDTAADETEPLPDWSTQTLTLQLINPLYNQVRVDELSQMLQLDESNPADVQADFALGLYYETEPANSLQPELTLRSELTILGADEERGLWNDLKVGIANRVVQQMRNRQYVQNLVRYPDRVRLVAAGDSWFQYPFLLRDIVDYLSGVFSVFSVATAGGTLSDYLKDSRLLEAIAQVKPQFFLLSAGGSELFGESLPSLLRDQPDSNQPGPSQYLSDRFTKALQDVREQFNRLLKLVHQGYPQVQILMHGYDYLMPASLENASHQTGTVSKVFTQKGITQPTDQEMVVRYIIDAFNDELRQLADTYPTVQYLDLRGTIQRADFWYDELHPTDKGFLSLASRFVKHIAPPDNTAVEHEQSLDVVRWPVELLESKRQVGDPLADQAIETLLADNQKGEIDQIFQMLVLNRQFPNPAFYALPEPVRDVVDNYFLQTRQLPPFADPFRLMVAADVFRLHGPKILFLVFCKSIPLRYTCWRVAKVLYRTGRFGVYDESLDAFSRQLTETAQFVADVLTHNNFEQDGMAVIAIQKVRLVNATIRYLTQQRGWDSSTYGVPLNQEDLVSIMLSFGIVIIDGLEQFGVVLTAEERNAYLHLWRVVGAMMGIDSDLLTENETEARTLMQAVLANQAGPSTEGKELTEACIDLLNERIGIGSLKRLTPYFVRYCLGDMYADMLHVPVDQVDDSFVLEAARSFDKSIRDFDDNNVLMAALSRSVSHHIVQRFLTSTNAAKSEQFYLPSALTDDWESVTPDFRVPVIQSIDEAIFYLDKVARHFRAQNNPMGLFSAIYKLVTERVAEGLRLNLFKNPLEMEQVDITFCNRYFKAINQFFDGKPASAPWQVTFDAARSLITTNQHILSAANAHITYDLPIVVAKVYAGKDMEPFRMDYEKMNALFDGMYNQMNDNVGRVFRPFGSVLKYFTDPIKQIENITMKTARDADWKKSQLLHQAADAGERKELLAKFESDSAAIGQLITQPPMPLRLPLQLIARKEFGTVAHKIDVMLRTALLSTVS